MQESKETKGHVSALVSVLIWGTTFVASKILLVSFRPMEILVFRFLFAFIALFILHPKILKTKNWKEEFLFLSAGLTGVALYFGFEITALTHTTASNVGIMVSISPFFTAILAKIFLKENSINKNFILGFLLAITGIVLISTQGTFTFKINPLGDILALLSALCWAGYSLLTKKISTLGYNSIATTHRIFFYGLLFLLPPLLYTGFQGGQQQLALPRNLLSILYLGLGASALCFLTWGLAIRVLGAVKTSIYIYLVPIISVVSSALVLKEKIQFYTVAGIILILSGLFFSENRFTQNLKLVKEK